MTPVATLEAQHRDLERDLYALSEERRRLVGQVTGQIEALHGNVPSGLLQADLATLSAHGARYALLDLRGARRHICYAARLSFATFRVDRADGCALVLYESTGGEETVIGQITADCFDPVRSWNRNEQPPKIWTAPYFNGRGKQFSAALLPLAGPILGHPAFASMAAYAEAALGHHVEEIAGIDTIDRTMDAIGAARAYLQERIEGAVYGDLDIVALEAAESDLIKRLERHDWTWREADRPNRKTGELEEQMLSDLARLPEDQARALWYRHNPMALNYATWTSAAPRIARLRRNLSCQKLSGRKSLATS